MTDDHSTDALLIVAALGDLDDTLRAIAHELDRLNQLLETSELGVLARVKEAR